jgi:Flp pilus assembly protein TadG
LQPQSGSDGRRLSLRARLRGHRGTAMIETAMTLPLVLLIAVGILDFGRAYETSQVLTNAAREGARIAVLPNSTTAAVQKRVNDYIAAGHLKPAKNSTVTITVDPNQTVDLGGGTTAKASLVTITFPYQFMVLGPVASLIKNGPALGAPFPMVATAEMRNEAQ